VILRVTRHDNIKYETANIRPYIDDKFFSRNLNHIFYVPSLIIFLHKWSYTYHERMGAQNTTMHSTASAADYNTPPPAPSTVDPIIEFTGPVHVIRV